MFKTFEHKMYIEIESFFRLVILKAQFKDQYNDKLTWKIKHLNLKKNQKTTLLNLINTITALKHLFKQPKWNFNNREISVTITGKELL